MAIIDIITTIIGLILLFLGLLVFIFEIIGISKYRFVLNRMHAAGMGDTLGIFLCMLGLMFISGLNFTTLKFALIVVFLWFSSPTASHLISGLETLTDEDLSKFADVQVENIKEYVDQRINGEEKDK